jgi:hypothetical protein
VNDLCHARPPFTPENGPPVLIGWEAGCVKVCRSPGLARDSSSGSTNNIRVRVGLGSTTFGFGHCRAAKIFAFGLVSNFIERYIQYFELSPAIFCLKKKLFVFARNSWHSQKNISVSDLALLVLQTRTARGLGIPDWYRREWKFCVMIRWPLLTYSIW